MTPAGVMRPIAPGTVLLLGCCVNQTLPSGPAVMKFSVVPGVMPAENSVTTPAGVIRPILFARASVNQRLPSGPRVIPAGPLLGAMPAENSVIPPAGVIRPIRLLPNSANQRLPSGPAVISAGWLPNGSENWVTTPAGVIRPIRSARVSANQRLPSGPRVIPSGLATNVSGIGNSVTDSRTRSSSASSASRCRGRFRTVARLRRPLPRSHFAMKLGTDIESLLIEERIDRSSSKPDGRMPSRETTALTLCSASTPLGCRPAQSRIRWLWPGPPSGENVGCLVVEELVIELRQQRARFVAEAAVAGAGGVAGEAAADHRRR